MKICLAQTKQEKGYVKNNIENHKKWIRVAISHKADIVVFSELSLTGYEPKLAKELALHYNDSILDDFQEISDLNNIAIGLGIPQKSNGGIFISMVIFQPNLPRLCYSKQKLHTDELPYFIEGNKQLIFKLKNTSIAPAICFESLLTEHSEKAHQLGAEVYLASVAKSRDGIKKASKHFPIIAKKHLMPVLMVNGVGDCDNFKCEGKTSVWDENGILVGQLDSKNEGILIFDTKTKELAT